MKISKLFHWLYAFLMFLPIVFLVPTALYYGFNDTATISGTHTETIEEYYPTDANANVGYFDTLQGGYAYTIQFDYIGYSSHMMSVPCDYVHIQQGTIDVEYSNTSTLPGFEYMMGNDYIDVYTGEKAYEIRSDGPQVIILDFVFTADTSRQADLTYPASWHDLNIHIMPCDRPILKGTTTINVPNNVTYEFSDNLNSIFELSLFSWTTNNALVAPFNSICSFFGISADSVIIKYLYYWLTISVVWLVFDVLMYIPLLVHNYIDKARIE